MWSWNVCLRENRLSQNMTMASLCVFLVREWQALISSVGIRLSCILKSFHLPSLRLARA